MKKLKYYIISAVLLFTMVTPVYASDIPILVPVEDGNVSTYAVTGETWTYELDFDMKNYWKSGYKLPTQWVNEYYTVVYEKDASNGYVLSSSIQPTFVSSTLKFTLVPNSESVFSYVGNKNKVYNKTSLTVTQNMVYGTTYEANNIIFSNYDIYDENNNLIHSADYQRVGSGSGTDPEPPPEDDITINGKIKIDYSDRNFFTTPLNDYTVTEGLLLFIFIFIAFDSLFKSRMKG